MEFLSFSSLLLWLSAYWVVERIIKTIYQHFSPETYTRLHRQRKDFPYFVFIMGILITLTSTPFCLHAFHSSSNSNDILGNNHLPPSGQICLVSRGVLWASELHRLDYSMRYILHHLASLGYLSYHLENAIPVRPIYLIYASLITELFGDTAALLTLHNKTPENSILAYQVHVVNLFVIIMIRVPACLYATTYVSMHPVSDVHFYLNLFSVGVYTWYNVNTINAISNRLRKCQPREKLLMGNQNEDEKVTSPSLMGKTEVKRGLGFWRWFLGLPFGLGFWGWGWGWGSEFLSSGFEVRPATEYGSNLGVGGSTLDSPVQCKAIMQSPLTLIESDISLSMSHSAPTVPKPMKV